MSKTLVLLVHPNIAESRTNKRVAAALAQNPACTVHDLYAAYPDFKIDVAHEQSLLAAHDKIVLQFPVYWYSSPALLKEWLDRVLTRGFAYAGGTALAGKQLQVSCSVGSPEEVYSATGRNKYPLAHFFAPFELTAQLCGMTYLPHYAIHAAHRLTEEELGEKAAVFAATL